MGLTLNFGSVTALPSDVNCGFMASVANFNSKYYVCYRGWQHDETIYIVSCDEDNLKNWTGFKTPDGAGAYSRFGPFLHANANNLFMIYKAPNESNEYPNPAVFYSVMDKSETWYGNTIVPGATTDGYPTMTEVNGVLFSVLESNQTNQYCYGFINTDDSGTVNYKQVPQIRWSQIRDSIGSSSFGPGIAYHPKLQKLVMAWKGLNTDTRIWWTTGEPFTDPTDLPVLWGDQNTMNDGATADFNVSLIYFGDESSGNATMYAFWRSADKDANYIKYAYMTDDSTWSDPVDVPGAESSSGPSVCASSDGKSLMIVYKGLEGGNDPDKGAQPVYYITANQQTS